MVSRFPVTQATTVATTVYARLALPVIWISFYGIEHTFAGSLFMDSAIGVYVDGFENVVRDRAENVNVGSTAFRLLLAAFGCVGLALSSGKTLNVVSPMLWTIGLYTLYLMSTVLWSVDREYTAFKLAVVAVFSVAALGIARQATLRELGKLFTLVCLGYIVFGIVAEMYFGTFGGRFAGTTHPNTQGVYGAVVCLGAVLFENNSRRLSILTVCLFLSGLATITMTSSRTSLAAMCLGLLAMMSLRAGAITRLKLATTTVIVTATSASLMALTGGKVLSNVVGIAAMGRTDDVGSLTGRLPLWKELFEAIGSHAWVGYGYMAYWTPDQVEHLRELLGWRIAHAHNMYLDVLIDGGVIGLGLFAIMLLVGLVTVGRQYVASRDVGAAFLFSLLVFALVHGMGESFFKLYGLHNYILVTMLLRFAWLRRDEWDVRVTRVPHHTHQPRRLATGRVA